MKNKNSHAPANNQREYKAQRRSIKRERDQRRVKELVKS